MSIALSDMTPVTVTLSETALRDMPAYVVPGNRWNGWLNPYFSLTTIRAHHDAWMEHAREVNELSATEADAGVTYDYGWNESTDLPYAREYWPGEPVFDNVSTVDTADGETLVTIGYAAFTWYAA